MRLRTRPLLALLVASACTAALAITDAPAGAVAATSGTRSTMLVFLRAGATRTATSSDALVATAQSEVADQVAAMGGRVLARTSVPDTLVVRLTTSQSHVLAVNPLVTEVLPNSEIPGPMNPGQGVVGASGRRVTPRRTSSLPASCGTYKDPQLNPEGIGNIDAAGSATQGFTGKGITVAFLADGLQVNNPDLVRSAANASAGSPAGTRVISQYEDFSGDGTQAATDGAEAFGDAASIAAQGRAIYDLSRYVGTAHPLPRGCDIRIEGSAPGASLLALKIFGQQNYSTGSGFVQAINYAVAHGASVINESFGSNGFPDTSADIVRAADEAAYAAGVTVVVSSGDAGVSSTIGSPATDPDVLAVGATTQFRAYQQQTFGGINLPGESGGGYLDNNISALSSGGFGQDGKTVDLVAPGDLGWSLCSANTSHFGGCAGMDVQLFGGTSESSPLAAGAAADVIEAYASSHGGTKPTPTQVMEILTSTAQDIGAPADQQGAGLLDVAAAVRLARSMAGTTISTPPGGIVANASEENLSGTPGSAVAATVDVTNTSKSPAALEVYTRALVPSGGIGGRIELDPSVRTKTPHFSIWSGALEVYRKVTFKVPAGTAREVLRAAYQYQGQSSLLHVVLFDPHGRLAAYSLPQGIGDYADIEVSRPEPGTWTAGFFTVWDGYESSDGTSGPIPFSVDFYRWAPLGTATPGTLQLAAGQTSPIAFHATLPSQPGDTDLSIVVHSPFGVTTIPVTLRTEVALSGSGGTFVGTLDGGNGRGGAPGQTNTYSLVVPSGEQNLQVAVKLASNPGAGEVPGVQLIALLVDPNGQTQAYDSNYTLGAGQNPVVNDGVELYVNAPVAGTWQLVLDWVQPGSGTRIAIPFRVTIGFDTVSATAPLPDSTGISLTDATAYPYTVTITNHGIAPLIVSPDARLNTTADVTLPDLEGTASTQTLPNTSNQYFVPPATTSLTITETATSEATYDAQPITGDPDLSPTSGAPYEVGSLTPSEATLTYTPPTGVASGLWGVVQSEIGPYPASGEGGVSETTSVSAVIAPFDTEVTSAVPDTVESLTMGGSVDPQVVAPGAQVQIQVTITPPASSIGDNVAGTLFVTGLTTGSFFGQTIAEEPPFTSVLAAIPYAFKVVS